MTGRRLAILTRAVFPLHGYGGLERHVFDLVRHLLVEGVGVTLITRPPTESGAAPADWLGHRGLRLLYVPYRTFPFAGRRGTTVIDRSTAYPLFGERAGQLAASLAGSGEIDLVHGLGASALGYARRRHRTGARRVPFVFNPQGLEEFGATDPSRARLKRLAYRPLQAAVRVCARAADRVIATDRVLEPAVLTHLRVPATVVRVIPNAVDLETCDRLARAPEGRAIRARYGMGPDDTVLVSAGRVEENKGFHVLIEALRRLASETATPLAGPWRWVLIGDGPYRSRLERMVSASGLASHVSLMGRASDADLHAWYEAATVFVHPTLYEGSSLVTLEAMAHGRAVVATRAGGLPDKVTPGVNGWLVEPGDAAPLAHAVGEALRNSAALTPMGRSSRAIVERRFSWPAVTRDLVSVYQELVPDWKGMSRAAAERSTGG